MPSNLVIVFGAVSLFFTLNMVIPALGATEAAKPTLSEAQIRTEFKKFEKPTLLTGHFEQQKKIKELDVTIKTSGKFEIKRKSTDQVDLTWKIEKPDPMMVCIDENAVVFDNPRLNKKTTLKMSEISQQDSSGLTKMIHLIKMNPDLLVKDFLIAAEHNSFIVTPKDSTAYQFAKAEIELDAKKNIKQINLHEVNGDTLLIRFSQTKESALSKAQLNQKVCH